VIGLVEDGRVALTMCVNTSASKSAEPKGREDFMVGSARRFRIAE
jgi:hypothetical protein